jgi:excinuclease ABC subunit C
MEFIITGTEKEALILENTLIKEHRPRYNVDFRDDKAYYNIRIDPPNPSPLSTRAPTQKTAGRFGPILEHRSEGLPLPPDDLSSGCRDQELKGRRRPCLTRNRTPQRPRVGGSTGLRRLVEDGITFRRRRMTIGTSTPG